MNIVEILTKLKQYIDKSSFDVLEQVQSNLNLNLFKPVESLPETPTADMMNTIYLVGSDNTKEEYIVIDKGEEAKPRYIWEKIGQMMLNMDGYDTIEARESAINRLQSFLTSLIDATRSFVPNGTTITGDTINFINNDSQVLFNILSANETFAGLLSAEDYKTLHSALEDIKNLETSVNQFKTDQNIKHSQLDKVIEDLTNQIPTGDNSYATTAYVDTKDSEIKNNQIKSIEHNADNVEFVKESGSKIQIKSASTEQAGVMTPEHCSALEQVVELQKTIDDLKDQLKSLRNLKYGYVPVKKVSSDYTATLEDCLIHTDAKINSLYLPDPQTCPGKIYYISEGGNISNGVQVKDKINQKLFRDNDNQGSLLSYINCKNDMILFISDGQYWCAGTRD